jgi:hypothetical protein
LFATDTPFQFGKKVAMHYDPANPGVAALENPTGTTLASAAARCRLFCARDPATQDFSAVNH